MKSIEDYLKIESGSPQFRIKISADPNSPKYLMYSQSDLINDLNQVKGSDDETAVIKTFDELKLLHAGDVVFSLISGEASLVTQEHEGYLYTQNYLKLVTNGLLDSRYLVYLLNNSVDIKKQLFVGNQGSIVKKITVKQIRGLTIPDLPSIEKQRLIGSIYFNQLKLQALKQEQLALQTKKTLHLLKEHNNGK